MMPRARSDNPVLDALLAAAYSLHPREIDLTLGRLQRLLDRFGNPEARMPPVFHVAGTNGKGSTVAFLRAGLEAAGLRVHCYTSPHLVRFNERIRLAGQLIDDDALAELLRELLARNAGQPITFFELTTALAFIAFSRVPADACVIEVGLGGRMDATNVIAAPLVTGIAALGLDHQQFLGNTILAIAGEKAGIAKRGVPLVTARYPRTVAARIAEVAGVAGAKLLLRGDDWDAAGYEGQLHFRDAAGRLALPLPRLPGQHQVDNAGLAIAMLRAQSRLAVPEAALRAAMGWAEWPARLQHIHEGPLFDLLPLGSELWIDGAHNPSAGRALSSFIVTHKPPLPLLLVVGMLASKDHDGFLKCFPAGTKLIAVPVEGHAGLAPLDLAACAATAGLDAVAADSLGQAFARLGQPARVLVCGSLHLAGTLLKENGPLPA
ncbi:bifunctional folylpolyglutamate synthase/dihydrofolate synthase [Polymorphobacter multimanifer]|uniref:tetrahydrofolate synthase n=1 Tax=Polymorphobacter multimanifer TaxID=1070431 RepID=A0A841L8R0_9SPHN|nr:folylpolyglutamate synthase/dihydrofolate synthase family protein [Polymorphobacter multimanifer]MBB6226225.1 dihydrofolate synthase/folylpolyglutamate synthase [Polymorphobacter multimanifer]GGI79662.1 bifunctional folylpolyglutamate synthase/dihydrofolate synthase [Polymorphobacter multimanifer]